MLEKLREKTNKWVGLSFSSNTNSKVLRQVITHISMVTEQIKRGFHSLEVSVMQPLVIRAPICQLMHLNLKLHVGNHPFDWFYRLRQTLKFFRLRGCSSATDLRPLRENAKHLWCEPAWHRITINYLICILCHVFSRVGECMSKKNQCVRRQRGRDREGVNEQLWQYFQYLLFSTECSCSGLWGAIKHPEMVGRFSL